MSRIVGQRLAALLGGPAATGTTGDRHRAGPLSRPTKAKHRRQSNDNVASGRAPRPRAAVVSQVLAATRTGQLIRDGSRNNPRTVSARSRRGSGPCRTGTIAGRSWWTRRRQRRQVTGSSSRADGRVQRAGRGGDAVVVEQVAALVPKTGISSTASCRRPVADQAGGPRRAGRPGATAALELVDRDDVGEVDMSIFSSWLAAPNSGVIIQRDSTRGRSPVALPMPGVSTITRSETRCAAAMISGRFSGTSDAAPWRSERKRCDRRRARSS